MLTENQNKLYELLLEMHSIPTPQGPAIHATDALGDLAELVAALCASWTMDQAIHNFDLWSDFVESRIKEYQFQLSSTELSTGRV